MSRPRRPGTLASDLAGALDARMRHDSDDAGLVERVRQRLMTQVRESAQRAHATVRGDEGSWEQLMPGVERKLLRVEDGAMSCLFRLAPGAGLPAHPHEADEECVMLEGSLRMGTLVLRAGDYHLARKGVRHQALTSDEGALFFIRTAEAA